VPSSAADTPIMFINELCIGGSAVLDGTTVAFS